MSFDDIPEPDPHGECAKEIQDANIRFWNMRDLAGCAKINFENFAKAFPLALRHPYFLIAKAQLDEALGEKTIEQSLAGVKAGELGAFREQEEAEDNEEQIYGTPV